MLTQIKTRLVSKIVPALFLTSQRHKSHYDVLGITPKATQSDIKTAYYRLSKLYHPDKSSDEESAKKFRAITEAYEVLGNVNLKKMYDKGLIIGRENTTRVDYHPDPEPTDPTLRFYKSRTRNVVPTMDGKTPIYDFDTWSQQHYGNVFDKSQKNKDILQRRRAKRVDDKQSAKQEFVIFSVLTVFLFISLIAYGTADYDQITVDKNNTENSPVENVEQK